MRSPYLMSALGVREHTARLPRRPDQATGPGVLSRLLRRG
jgi:hypothetical protein